MKKGSNSSAGKLIHLGTNFVPFNECGFYKAPKKKKNKSAEGEDRPVISSRHDDDHAAKL